MMAACLQGQHSLFQVMLVAYPHFPEPIHQLNESPVFQLSDLKADTAIPDMSLKGEIV
jgi:hypothetical protein